MLKPETLKAMPGPGEVRRFPSGAEAPAWLVDLEPFHPQAIRAPIYFSGPTDVINTGDRFIILPLYAGQSPVGALNTAAQGCNIFAGTQEVRMVTHALILNVDPMMEPGRANTNPAGISQGSPPPRSEEPSEEVVRLRGFKAWVLRGVGALLAFGLVALGLHFVR